MSASDKGLSLAFVILFGLGGCGVHHTVVSQPMELQLLLPEGPTNSELPLDLRCIITPLNQNELLVDLVVRAKETAFVRSSDILAYVTPDAAVPGGFVVVHGFSTAPSGAEAHWNPFNQDFYTELGPGDSARFGGRLEVLSDLTDTPSLGPSLSIVANDFVPVRCAVSYWQGRPPYLLDATTLSADMEYAYSESVMVRGRIHDEVTQTDVK